MKAGEPIFEKSRSVEDLERMRLMALLRELAAGTRESRRRRRRWASITGR